LATRIINADFGRESLMPHHEVRVLIEKLDTDLGMPRYAQSGDAGLDLYSRISFSLKPGDRVLVPTGIAIALPPGYVGFVNPRSGLSLRHGVTVVNGPGTVDASFRGEIGVILINTDTAATFECARGDRIAQLVILPFAHATLEEVTALPGTTRSDGGFGSSGQ
jgi:dUTP pyrophosphatase